MDISKKKTKKEIKRLKEIEELNKLNVLKKDIDRALGLDIAFDSRKDNYVYGRSLYFRLAKTEVPTASMVLISGVVGKCNAAIVNADKKFENLKINYDPNGDIYYKVLGEINPNSEELKEENSKMELIKRIEDLEIENKNLKQNYGIIASFIKDLTDEETKDLVDNRIIPFSKMCKSRIIN